MKILVVDDERVVAALIAEAVRLQGHEAVIAHNGEQAIELVELTSPDAVFLDLGQRGLPGIELITRIRVAYPALPVIVFAERRSGGLVAKAQKLGVTDVVEKPIALARLNQSLEQLRKAR